MAATKKATRKAEAPKATPAPAAAKTVKPADNGKATATATAKPKAPALKLTDNQKAFLGKIQTAGEAGYDISAKPEQRTVDALLEKKLLKKGAKDKTTGKVRYHLTKLGQKHVPAATTPA